MSSQFAEELVLRRLRVAPVLQHRGGRPAVDGELADRVDHGLAVVVEHDGGEPRQRLAQRSRTDRVHRRAVADAGVELGLPVALVHGRAEELLAPLQQVGAQGLAAGADRAEAESAALDARRADHAQGGGRQQGQRQPELAHQPHRPLGGERRLAVDHHGQAVEPGRHEDVHDPGDPGPVGRRPDHVVGLREELVDRLEGRHVPEDDAMGVQRALGIAGRARGVDEERRVLRGRVHRREFRRRRGQRVLVATRHRCRRSPAAAPARRRRRAPRAPGPRSPRPSPRPWRRRCAAGSAARRDRTATTAAARPRPSGTSP